VATAPDARGVVAVVAGHVHAARDVRKIHPQRLDALGSGDAGPLASVEDGRLRMQRPWPADDPRSAFDLDWLPANEEQWPWVAIVASGPGADPRAVRTLVDAGVSGIVVAATGNGTVHRTLELPLREAQARGCAVLRTTRCLAGAIVEPEPPAAEALPSAGALTPQQARVELVVRLLEKRGAASA
jgi:L-asparaginase